MSAVVKVTTTLSCDDLDFSGRSCAETFTSDNGLTDTRRLARAEGWRRVWFESHGHMGDLCPTCAESRLRAQRSQS